MIEFTLIDEPVNFTLDADASDEPNESEPMLDFSIDTNSQYIPLF